MGFTEAVETCFRKYVTFSGRASRSEYWYWILFDVLCNVVFEALGYVFSSVFVLVLVVGVMKIIFALGTFVPSISVMARRLHDLGKSGWWQLLSIGTLALGIVAGSLDMPLLVVILLMLSGSVILIVWFVRRGTVGDNRFGPDPLAEPAPADAAFAEG